MNFVHGTSLEEEKQIQFSRQTNEEFYAQKKQQQQAKDVSKKTCFKCQYIGHVGRKCPQNLKSVDVEKKKQKSEAVKQKSHKFELKQTWKPNPNLSQNRFGNQRLRHQSQNKLGNQKHPSLNQTKSGNQKLIYQKEMF
ncbi:putative transcription factor interactor and regulator CCHC(Zn) family [Helianthus anomalus]